MLKNSTDLSWIYKLYLLGQEVASLENARALYQQILSHVVKGFSGKSGSLALCNKDGSSLTIVAGIDLPIHVIGTSIPLGTSVLGWVAGEQKGLLLNGNVSTDPRFKQYKQRTESTIPRSSICWPLKIQERVIGAVSLNRPSEEAPFTEADLEKGTMILDLVSLALGNIQLNIDQQQRISELRQTNKKLEEAHNQLLQAEKMASIGQLAAGVAHEINNPIGYVYSNLFTMEKYILDLFKVLDSYETVDAVMGKDEQALAEVHSLKRDVDLPFIKKDIMSVINESKEGIIRVKTIVSDLKDFSHVADPNDWQLTDLHAGLDSTLNIIWNEIKYKAEVKKEYGTGLPKVECLASQINQVFMNLLVNASHAIEGRGTITIRTGHTEDEVWIEISDTGTGIPPENLNRIFDPFFTTKPIGKGTGLGLSLSYGIVQKHNGRIDLKSKVGEGTTFKILLPVKRRPS